MSSQCVDINECYRTDICPDKSRCQNTEGSYVCLCETGFKGETCNDMDECLTETDNCDVNAECINSFGSFYCECRPGFTGDGKSCKCKDGFITANGTCTDIDECSDSVCDTNAECSNSEGSYQCDCKHGFYGDGRVRGCI